MNETARKALETAITNIQDDIFRAKLQLGNLPLTSTDDYKQQLLEYIEHHEEAIRELEKALK